MASDFLGMFDRFFQNENRMDSTYKPVFLRALLDLGDLCDPKRAKTLVGRQWVEFRGDKVRVDLDFVAARFAKYYWDMEYSFHLRQSRQLEDANILKLVGRGREKPPTIEEMASADMGGFRAVVIRRSIKPEVLVHLLTDMSGFYEKCGPQTIEFDEGIVAFLHSHKTVLRKALNGVIVRHLEKINAGTPQIAEKVDCAQSVPGTLKREAKREIEAWQDSRCFYCQDPLRRALLDHVIPYNFVFRTYTHNCTLVCQGCSQAKSDSLPEERLFEGVLERNRDIRGYLDRGGAKYNEKSYVGLFHICMDEYGGGTFFSPDR